MKRLFLLLAMTFMLSTNFAALQKTYIRAQVDSIVAVEVKQQLDQMVAAEVQKQLAAQNAQIELLVEKSSQDKLGTYITEQNNQLTRQNTYLTILITILMALLGVGAPILINKQNEKKLEAIAKENKKIKAEIETMRVQVESRAKEAEESKEEAQKAKQAAKASELFSQAINEKDLDKKIELYTEVLKISPDADAYNNRGNAYDDKGVYDKAIDDYNHAIELRPDEVVAYNNRGVTYSKIGDYRKAMKDYNQAIRIKPNYVEAYNNRGNVYSVMGDYQKAMDEYSYAISIRPDYAEAYYNRGIIFAYKNEFKEALNELEQSIRLNPDFDVFKHGLQIVRKLQTVKNLMEESDFDNALKIANEALEIAIKINDDSDDWVKIVERKIKEIEGLQNTGKP